jgi:hypothetical protein
MESKSCRLIPHWSSFDSIFADEASMLDSLKRHLDLEELVVIAFSVPGLLMAFPYRAECL